MRMRGSCEAPTSRNNRLGWGPGGGGGGWGGGKDLNDPPGSRGGAVVMALKHGPLKNTWGKPEK